MTTPAFELTQSDLDWLTEAGIRERQNRRYAEVRAELAAIAIADATRDRAPTPTVTPQSALGHVLGYALGLATIALGIVIRFTTPDLSGGTILAVGLILAGGCMCVRIAVVSGLVTR